MDATRTSVMDDPNRRRPVGVKNVELAFGPLNEKYPPILSLEQAAEIALLAPSTLKRKVSEGHFKYCVSRKKPLRFWRNKFVVEVMR